MDEVRQSTSGAPRREARFQVGARASRQFGRISWAQLRRLGIGEATIVAWRSDGYLTRVLPRVYAVGHCAPSAGADLCAALLYAGPGAMLSHASGAWWQGLIAYPPEQITLSTPRRVRSRPGIRVYGARPWERVWHGRLPTTPIERTVIDLAANARFPLVRRALAQLDFQRRLDVAALEGLCVRGRAGSTCLRRALAHHEPRFAYTRSALEDGFLVFCERFGLPLPEVNVLVHGILVDAYWPDHGLVVELDGSANHETWAQIQRDRSYELALRGHGLEVRRYTLDQVHGEPLAVREDLLRSLDERYAG